MKYNRLSDNSSHGNDVGSLEIINLNDSSDQIINIDIDNEENENNNENDTEIECDWDRNEIQLLNNNSSNSKSNLIILYEKLCILWSTIFFSWMRPLLRLGNIKPLESKDLIPLFHNDTSEYIYNLFRKSLLVQNTIQNEHNKPNRISLPWILMKSYGKPFILAGVLKLIHDTCLFIGPVLLNRIIIYIKSPDQPLSLGLFYVVMLFISQISMALCLRQYFWWCYRVGMRLRSAVITSVFNKSLDISSSVLFKRSTGEITNLMSVDSTRLQDLTPYLHAIWYSFYQIVIALTLLWLQLGAATLAGTFVIVAAIPLTRYVSSYLKSIQKKLSKARDNRVKICNEVFIGIKVIKFQSWEEKYSLKILAARQVELDLLRQYMIGQSIASALYISIPLLVSISTFTTYTLLGNKELDVSTTLTSLALFDLLRFPLYMLPNVLNNLIEAKISIDRLESFYNEPDRNIVPCLNMRGNNINNHNKYYPCILIKNASFVWDSSTFKKKRVVKHSIIFRDEDNLFRKFQLFFIKLKQASGLQNEIVRNNESVIYVDKSDEEFTIDVMNCIQSETNILIDQLEYKLVQLNQSHQSLNDNPVGIVTSSYPLNDSDNDTFNQKRDILTLFRINLMCYIGQLTGIVGCVGSGKSSMLSAILGDIKLYNGSIHLDSSSTTISYVSQRPFIQNSTLRENILFGNKYNETLYNQVLLDCCLLQDLSILPAGDLTEIGERGINISGGQKSRIALARSLYANNSIYLLDDPLSAVDAHVGQYLFDNVILKLKSLGKCVVLVTNAMQYIKFMDNTVVLDKGRITQHGSYSDLMNDTNGLLCQMMSSYNETLRQSEDNDNLKIKDSNFYDNNIVEVKLNTNASIVNNVEISKKVGDGKLITVEDREVGDVNINVYIKWLESSGGIIVGFILLLLCIANESSNILGQWWISQLSQSFSTKHHNILTSKWFHLVVYVLINIVVIAIVVSQELFIRTKSLNSSKKLFSNMLERILYTPMSFYDTTPIGRISNRFIKDIYTIDEQLPQTIRSYSGNIIKICSVLLYISIITPLFLILLLPIMLFYYYSQRYYIKTSRELSRLDSVSRSPIYAMFSETLDGLTTIRAYCKEDILRKKLYNLLNNNQNAYFLNFSANCWLGIRLDCVGAFIVSFTALCAILAKQNILYNNFNQHEDSTNNKLVALAALSGLAISLSLNCTQSLNWSVRMASDLESQMISVERINMFTQLEQESSHHKQLDNTLVHWPNSGVIEMINVSMRYRDNLPFVLKNINLFTRPMEKIGIVGRTGSGKSSLVSILLRLVEISEGIIKIDGIDTSSVGLHKLRSSISVIPQDPLLFSGTLRNNLDPFSTYTDSALYQVLQNCQLNEFSLDMEIEENGNNLSIGQKQLICIARALVCSSKIIIMDEATAAIDIQTDNIIQKTMKEQFSQCTCLTIAHRLNTILDSDRVLVMSDGNIVEFDTPNQLLQQKSSAFAKLVNEWDSSSS